MISEKQILKGMGNMVLATTCPNHSGETQKAFSDRPVQSVSSFSIRDQFQQIIITHAMRHSLTFLLFLYPLFSQSQSLFFNTYGTTEAEERAFDMVVLSDGSIITIGDRYQSDSFTRTGHLLKVDTNGNEQWNRQLSSNAELYGTTICQLPNGNVFVSGHDHDVPTRNFGIVVAEYNGSNGLPIYQATHEFAQDTKPVDCIATADNGAIVLSTFETTSTKTILLVKFDSNGDTVWTKVVDPFLGKEDPREMAVVSDGIVITGSVHSGSTDNVFLLKTDMGGNILWQEEYPSSGLEFGESVSEIPSGGFYLAGTSNSIGSGGLDLLVMKVNGTGQLIWVTDFGRDGSELGYDIATMTDGGAVLTGSAYKADSSNLRDLVLIRIDADGYPLWINYFGDVRSETGYEVQVKDDRIVVCGKADVDDSEDVAIVRADLNGNASVGIDETGTQREWNIYPNPFTDLVTVQLSEFARDPIEIQLSDMAGRMILETSLSTSTILDLADLRPGIYIATLRRRTGAASPIRLIKR